MKKNNIKKKTPLKRRVINTISILIIVLSSLTIAACAFLVWQPFKEAGAGVSLPETVQKNQNQQAWNGSFENFLVVGRDVAAGLTDVMMVVSFDNQTGKISILQIPRDTYSSDTQSKYNAIYNLAPKGTSGMAYLISHVEKDFGIKIDHYAAITTKGLDQLVDAAGGVDLTVPIDMYYNDPAQDLHINLKKGYQHLDGEQAVQFVRFRHGYSNADIGRLDAQKLFLAAFSKKLQGMSYLQLSAKILPVLVSNKNFTTDMNGMQMIQFGLAAQKINMAAIDVQTMPGEGFTIDGQSYYSVHKAQLLEILNKYFVPQGVVLNESDLGIRQMANTGEDESYSSGDFQTIIDKQTGRISSSSSETSSSSAGTSNNNGGG